MSPGLRRKIAAEIRKELAVLGPHERSRSEYRKLGLDIADRLEQLPAGAELPTMGELATEYGVPRLSVQRMHHCLVKRGILEAYPRGGPLKINDELVLRAARLAS